MSKAKKNRTGRKKQRQREARRLGASTGMSFSAAYHTQKNRRPAVDADLCAESTERSDAHLHALSAPRAGTPGAGCDAVFHATSKALGNSWALGAGSDRGDRRQEGSSPFRGTTETGHEMTGQDQTGHDKAR